MPCPDNQIGTSQGVCCPASQATSNGNCCPSGFHVEGASCVIGTMMRRSDTPDTPARCADGLVPREAFRDDRVCVTQAVHEQTIADNIAAPSRTLPNGLCMPGYLWRRANPSDHVCVTPPARAQAQSDNSRASSQGLQPSQSQSCSAPSVMRDGKCMAARPSTAIRVPGTLRPRHLVFRPPHKHPTGRSNDHTSRRTNTQHRPTIHAPRTLHAPVRTYRPPARTPVFHGRRH